MTVPTVIAGQVKHKNKRRTNVDQGCNSNPITAFQYAVRRESPCRAYTKVKRLFKLRGMKRAGGGVPSMHGSTKHAWGRVAESGKREAVMKAGRSDYTLTIPEQW